MEQIENEYGLIYTYFSIHDMRDTHYIIFCHSENKQLIVVF